LPTWPACEEALMILPTTSPVLAGVRALKCFIAAWMPQ
jgi:hypothetical protein